MVVVLTQGAHAKADEISSEIGRLNAGLVAIQDSRGGLFAGPPSVEGLGI